MAFRYKDDVPFACRCGAWDDEECTCYSKEYDGDWISRRPGDEQTWNPQYNSDYFDPSEVDEYGEESEELYSDRHDRSIDYEDEYE